MTYHLSQTTAHVVDAPFVRTTYHDAWVSRYLLRGYVLVDPVVQQGFSRLLPFDWREIDPPPGGSVKLTSAKQKRDAFRVLFSCPSDLRP
ncbi:autoinducer binding domain-containing protein [Agrobacterium tumefaciens]|uniref:autoinducer binding domain-containing protein n=1 Tax=Agrobacterium tumefaciens TaxID=358 RepID=UPI003AF5BBD2